MEQKTPNATIDDQLKLSQIEKIQAETRKIISDSKNEKKDVWASKISELIKVIAGIVVGIGGFAAAKTQYEIAEMRANTANEKLSYAENAASAASAAATTALRQKYDLELTIADLKKTHAELTQRIQETNPKLISSRLVYIQFNGSITREKINSLRSTLETKGFSAPGGERVAGTYQAQVKYFTPADEQAAEKLANEVQLFLERSGCTSQKIRIIPSTAPNAKASPLEIWLPSDCK